MSNTVFFVRDLGVRKYNSVNFKFPKEATLMDITEKMREIFNLPPIFFDIVVEAKNKKFLIPTGRLSSYFMIISGHDEAFYIRSEVAREMKDESIGDPHLIDIFAEIVRDKCFDATGCYEIK